MREKEPGKGRGDLGARGGSPVGRHGALSGGVARCGAGALGMADRRLTCVPRVRFQLEGLGWLQPFSPSSPALAAAPASSSGRKSTLPVQELVHAFHCQEPHCQHKKCPDTKRVLKRMEAHVAQCPVRKQAQMHGLSLPECKVCKLWQALHRTRNNAPPASLSPISRFADSLTGSGSGDGDGASPSSNADAVRQKLRQLDPAAVKRMLLQHVRSCQNKQCHTCHKLRERIKASRVASAAANLGAMPPLPKGNPIASTSSGKEDPQHLPLSICETLTSVPADALKSDNVLVSIIEDLLRSGSKDEVMAAQGKLPTSLCPDDVFFTVAVAHADVLRKCGKFCLPTCTVDDDNEMVLCDHCGVWFHCECVGLSLAEAEEVRSFAL